MRQLIWVVPAILAPTLAAAQTTMGAGRALKPPSATPPAARAAPRTRSNAAPTIYGRLGPPRLRLGAIPTRPQITPAPPPRPRSRAGFIQLPASGPGYYAYAGASRRWGTPAMIYGIERAARRWSIERRTLRGPSGRIGVGDVSRENGGRFAPHVSHRRGVDVDVRPQRGDGTEGPTAIGRRSYSRDHTRRVIEHFQAELKTRVLLFNDRAIRGTRPYRGHSNHFHLRI